MVKPWIIAAACCGLLLMNPAAQAADSTAVKPQPAAPAAKPAAAPAAKPAAAPTAKPAAAAPAAKPAAAPAAKPAAAPAAKPAAAPAAKPAAAKPVVAKPTAAKPSAPKGSPEELVAVQTKLDAFALKYLGSCNNSVRPCKSSPEVSMRDGKMVASYMEFDVQSITTEVMPSSNREFSYLGKLVYVEHTYESIGATKDEALHGNYQRVRSRRLTELPRYVKGAWVS